MISLPPLSLYIHLPWCVAKCPYCDFNSHALAGELPEERYVDALLTLPEKGIKELIATFEYSNDLNRKRRPHRETRSPLRNVEWPSMERSHPRWRK